ncbi:hypothetical protein LEP1GSC038_2623 [Leptospira weilii str. 2006001855]|uniref:Uncharacterized protein n=1 Tax=Leptospira weilii str. 2006001855 TaxID=996804 RepID=M6FLQ0_9LEPT|nr:hypothetical protein LEP1GSC038_2623 [Leptospira weilii str. 2006001855]
MHSGSIHSVQGSSMEFGRKTLLGAFRFPRSKKIFNFLKNFFVC